MDAKANTSELRWRESLHCSSSHSFTRSIYDGLDDRRISLIVCETSKRRDHSAENHERDAIPSTIPERLETTKTAVSA